MSDGDFALVESFGIDDGQLDVLSRQMCFVLGYELALISQRAETELDEFQVTVHAENEQRLTAALEKRGRSRIMTWMAGDSSEGWLLLTVLRKV